MAKLILIKTVGNRVLNLLALAAFLPERGRERADMKRLLPAGIGLGAIIGALVYAQFADRPDREIADPAPSATASSPSQLADAPEQGSRQAAEAGAPSFLQLATGTAALQAATEARSARAIGAPGLVAFAQAPAPDYQPEITTGSVKPVRSRSR